MADEPTVPGLDEQLRILAELRGAFREAQAICDWSSLRLRAATSEIERERIGAEIQGFFKRISLAGFALGSGLGNNETEE